jgi:pilus assembly protein CpaE
MRTSTAPDLRDQDMSETGQTLLWVHDGGTTDSTQLQTVCRELGITPRVCGANEIDASIDRSVSMIGLDLGDDSVAGIRRLQEIRERHPNIPIFVASALSNVSTMRAALQHGATDFLSLPMNPLDLSRVVIRLAQDYAQAPKKVVGGEIVTVYGCRGGLGATTLSVNLAIQLEALGRGEVAVVDLDLQRGDVSAFLNLVPSQSIAALADSRGDIDEIFLHSAMTRHPSGMFVLAAPDKVEDADSVGHDEVTYALRLLRTQYRFCVVDTPRTITAPTIAAFEQADVILLLADRSVPGVRAAQRTVQLLERLDVQLSQIRLVIADAHPGPVGVDDAERTIGLRPYLTLPRDESTAAAAMNTGSPLDGGRSGGLTSTIADLAHRIAGSEETHRKRGGLIRRFFSREARA